MTVRAGELWVADIPFTNGAASKKRPVLVLWVVRRRRGRHHLKPDNDAGRIERAIEDASHPHVMALLCAEVTSSQPLAVEVVQAL